MHNSNKITLPLLEFMSKCNVEKSFHTNQQISHLKSLNTNMTMIYVNGNPGPGLGQAQKYGGVKPVIGITTFQKQIFYQQED